jgi:hypothetical protein
MMAPPVAAASHGEAVTVVGPLVCGGAMAAPPRARVT